MSAQRFVAGLVLVLCAAWPVAADDAEIKKTAKAKAEACQSALLKGDSEAFADLTHPRVVEESGGREKFVAATKELMKKMQDSRYTWTGKIGEPTDPVRGGKQVFVIVPTTLELSTGNGKATTTSHLLGVSADGGKTWRFVDGARGSAATRKMFPELPESVTLPKIEYKVVKD